MKISSVHAVSARNTRLLVLVSVLLNCLLPAVVWGRRPSPAKAPVVTAPSEAETSDLSGAAAALARHELVPAEQQLVAAYRRTRAAEALYLLGAVARERGDTLVAHDYWRRYVGDPAIDTSTPHAQEAQKFLDLQITQGHGPAGELQVVGEAGALVLVDGRLLGALPLALPLLLSVATHQVRVEVQRKTLAVELQIADGRGTEVRVVPDYDALLVSVPPAVLLLADWTGPAPAAQRRLVQEAQQAIRRANHAVFDTDTALGHAPQYRGCLREQGCRQKLAAHSEIDFVLSLQGTAPASGSGAWHFTSSLHSPLIAVPAAIAQRDCPRCTVEQAAALLAALIEELVQKGGARGRGLLQVTSQPQAAVISLGSLVLGKTPATLPLWVGSYELTLALPGAPAITVQAKVSDGATALSPVQLTLAAPKVTQLPPVAPTRAKRPLWRLVVGGIALAGGALMIGNGISAAVVNGQCVHVVEGTESDCVAQESYMTGGAAAGLLGAGAALAVGGVILLAIPGRKSP